MVKHELIDGTKGRFDAIGFECTKCKFKGEKVKKWNKRFWLGIVFCSFGLLPGLIYFTQTSPWICPKCGEREHIIKLTNDGEKEKIEAKPKSEFVFTAIVVLIILTVLVMSQLVGNLNS